MKTTQIRNSLLSAIVLSQLVLSTWAARADEKDDRIRELEKRLDTLEKKYEAILTKESQPPPAIQPAPAPPPLTGGAEKPKTGPTVYLCEKGFRVETASKDFAVRLGTLIQEDYRAFFDDGLGQDTFTLRRARIIFGGTVFTDFDFLLTADFGGSQKNIIKDAWLNYRYEPSLQLRAGKMKPPVNLERWQGAGNTLFIERSVVSALAPARDLGVMFHGDLLPGEKELTDRLAWTGIFNYAVGAFNGVGDSWTAEKADIDEDKSVDARLFVQPFLRTDIKPLEGFGVGLAGTYGKIKGRLGLPDGGGYLDEGQAPIFQYAPGVIADGTQWRLFPQAYYYWGPFGMMAEGGFSSVPLRQTIAPVASERVRHTAWEVTASYLLTGEEATFKAVEPKKNFKPFAGGWGAWQAVARYSHLGVDDDAFPVYADPLTSISEASTWGVGLNWFLNRNIRTSFDFLRSDLGVPNRSTLPSKQNVFLMRMQLAF